MSGLAFWGPFALTVLSNVLYHNIAKWTPVSLSPMLGLGVTYFVSFVLCVIGYYFTGGGIRNDIQDLNWVSFAWGVVLVGIEAGYLLKTKNPKHIAKITKNGGTDEVNPNK